MTDFSRREFLTTSAAAGLAGSAFATQGDAGWQRRIRRVGQLNMTEHDPVEMDVEAWADYWASLKVDAVLVSVTGILAFYQTKVPFHHELLQGFEGTLDCGSSIPATGKHSAWYGQVGKSASSVYRLVGCRHPSEHVA